MAKDYIPASDADLVSFMNNFYTTLEGLEGTLGIPEGFTTALNTKNVAFGTKRQAHLTAQIAAKVATQDKTAARNALVDEIRSLVRQLQANPLITDVHCADLGITIRDTVPTAISAPSSAPILSVDFSQRGQHKILFSDTETPNSSAKPAGAVALKLYRKISEAVPSGIEAMELYGQLTKSGETITYPEADYGSQVWYCGVWVTAKGLVGPPSDFTNATIAK